MTTREGVFAILDLELPPGAREDWLAAEIVVPAERPPELVTTETHLPDADGLLPSEVRVDAPDLATALERAGTQASALLAHERDANGHYRLVIAGELGGPVQVDTLVQRMRRRHADGIEYAATNITRGGACCIEAYFGDYDALCFAFDPWLLVMLEAAKLGGQGEGVMLYDEGCAVPVALAFAIRDGAVTLVGVDPQDVVASMIPRWGDRCEAIREAHAEWADAQG